MKKFALFVCLLLPTSLLAQNDTTYWNKGGSFGINFNQATLTNWSAGGSSSISGAVNFKYIFDYEKDDELWQNTIDMGIGYVKQSDSKQRKADDRLVLTSSYGRKIFSSPKWYFNGTLDFRTQFAKGFKESDVNNDSPISDFMAPGYMMASIGIDWRPKKFISVTLSPATGKFTFVTDDDLSAIGAFGVDPGDKARAEVGGKLIVSLNKEIFKNGAFTSNLLLFSNYTNNPDKVDVNWENILDMKINSVLSANIYNQIIYDYDIKFEELNDMGEVVGVTDKWQFKNIIGLGLSFKFGGSRG